MALVQIHQTPRWKKLLSHVGPGFLVSVAYLDPGNLEIDLQAGADQKYQLLWIVLIGLGYALIIQSRAANLGVATGRHLSEHCKMEYPKAVKYCLWALAELAVIAADIPEVIGTAFAIKMLFNIPIWGGVLLAGLNTLLLLGLQRYGIRKLEMVITGLMMVMGGCFFSVMIHADPRPEEIFMGMFVPKLNGNRATRDAVALLGALIMPHNLYLHSALVTSRKIPHTSEGIQSASKYFMLESGVALLMAFMINVAVVSVSATVCSNPSITPLSKAECKDITLESASSLLKNALGTWSSKLYAISLLASGQSSTVTGTYAGQYIMQGFLDLKMEIWLRNLVTRSISIIPSLIVCLTGGPDGAAKLIIVASMVLSFELPFALIPLLRFTSSQAKMGYHKSSKAVTLLSWILGTCTVGINMYFIGITLTRWMTSDRMPKAGSILIALFVFPLGLLYLAMLAYLTMKKETSVAEASGATTICTETIEKLDSKTQQRDENIDKITMEDGLDI